MRLNIKPLVAVFLVIALLFIAYGSVYIYQTSFVIDGTRYFCLFDDTMISMRYAKNLASGEGLVMNPGERVEGITNPLWTLYMTLLHLLPVPAAKISLLVQITGLCLHIATIWLVMRLACGISDDPFRVGVGAMVLTAFYLPLVSWSLQGMEVSLITFIITLSVYWSTSHLTMGTLPRRVFLLLGIGTLVRIDMVVPYLAALVFFAFFVPVHRKRIVLRGLLLLIGILTVQTLMRLAYYGDPLPNTYYLKMTGYPLLLRVARGMTVFWDFIWRMVPVTFFIPVIALGKESNRARYLLAWLFAGQCAYSIFVGGDAWESWYGSNRYISSAMPLFFVLFAAGLDRLARLFVRIPSEQWKHSKAVRIINGTVFACLVIVCGVLMNNNEGPLSLRAFVFKEPPMLKTQLNELIWLAAAAETITTSDASVAVTWAGALPYFSGRYTVDLLGKTDRHIAHIDMRQPPENQKYTFFYPGHLKYDYTYSLGERKPDVIFQLWNNLEEAQPFIEKDYVQVGIGRRAVYLRKNSPHIRWELFTDSGSS